MRKRGKPAREQEVRSWPSRAEQTREDTAPEPESSLEDDGLVFWPSSLGQPEGPRLVQVGPRLRRQEPAKPQPPRPRRLATTLLFALLFFAGAALTAAAGNEVATIVASNTQSAESQGGTTTDPTVSPGGGGATTSTDPAQAAGSTQTSTDAATTTTVPSSQTSTDGAITTTEPSSQTSTGGETTTTDPTSAAGQSSSDTTTTDATSTDTSATATTSSGGQPTDTGTSTDPSNSSTTTTSQPAGSAPATTTTGTQTVTAPTSTTVEPVTQPQPVLAPQPEAQSPGKSPAHKRAWRAKSTYVSLKTAPSPHQIEPEVNPVLGLGAVRWINQPLPDPTPPSLRLTAQFARELRATSAANGLDWWFLLAVLRAERSDGSGQVEQAVIDREAAALGPLHNGVGDRAAALAYKHDQVFAERVLVLEHYYRALGLKALVEGLAADRDVLAARILADPRIDIYPGGRDDISSGRVDVRVLAMIAFLSESFGDVRVSCLITGHRLYARPGVISAHIYGRAVDIGALNDISILGHQQPGGVTEQAVRQILFLPAEMLPRQVISLLGLGGPSFALADHYDHIHIGY